jgi:hypothetical protein
MPTPLCVRQGVPQGQTESGGCCQMPGRECPEAVLPDRALYLPTASHLFIVYQLSLSLSRTPFGVPSSLLQPMLIAGSPCSLQAANRRSRAWPVLISRRIVILAGTDVGCTRLAGAQIADNVNKRLWHCNQQVKLQLQWCFSPVGPWGWTSSENSASVQNLRD